MRMVNHWAVPAWHRGRPFSSWYLTFEDHPELHDLADHYTRPLAGLHLDPLPHRWLHLTMQSVAIADQVPEADVRRIGEAAAGRCAGLAPFDVTFSEPVVLTQAVVLPATPRDPLQRLREALQAAIADVWGRDAVLGAEHGPAGFVPHVTIAYSRGDGPAGPVADAVRAVDRRAVAVTVRAAHLLAVRRDIPAYRWTSLAAAPLGAAR